MDRFSFLNAVHPSYIAELYDTYLQFPDSIEPSWRSFFQGFDFGIESGSLEALGIEPGVQGIPENVLKEFQVIKLIDGYRTRGHLFTQTNPVRERRKYHPTLALENFGLAESDLDSQFEAGSVLGLGKNTLREIVRHVEAIYCDAIGVEYMYIRNPDEIKWIQNWINTNDNQPTYSSEEKKHLLKKLNEALSFETFLHSKYVGQKRFSVEGVDALIPGLDCLIQNGAEKELNSSWLGWPTADA